MAETKDVRQYIIKNKPRKYEDMWEFLFVVPQLVRIYQSTNMKEMDLN